MGVAPLRVARSGRSTTVDRPLEMIHLSGSLSDTPTPALARAARPEFRWYALSRVTPRDDAQPCSTSSGTGGASRRATAVDNLGAPGSVYPVETRRRSAGARRPPGSGCMPPRLRYGPAPGRAGPTLVGSGFPTCGSSVHNSMVHSEWTVCVPVGATQSGSTCGMCIRPSPRGCSRCVTVCCVSMYLAHGKRVAMWRRLATSTGLETRWIRR